MTDHRFTLDDVTQAAGEALKLLTPAERLASDRSVAVVLQGMIDRLKALAAREELAAQAQELDMGYGGRDD